VTDIAPLYGLRLRTSRLELRLGSAGEIRELGQLAELGIHPPDEMPFSVAWTDEIGRASFVDGFTTYHRDQLAAWRPDDWHLNLLVWVNGELAGTQELYAGGFAEQREVGTGSWLGATFQGRGIGTEMRAAVLDLGFTGLGAATAVSSWLDGNETSRRVSEKLGYVPAGEHTESPRGVPVTAHVARLARTDWSPPEAVEIVGLAPTLALFGADQPSDRSAAPSD
jgi:RimJ/RimL family protein N-acetyltransferase